MNNELDKETSARYGVKLFRLTNDYCNKWNRASFKVLEATAVAEYHPCICLTISLVTLLSMVNNNYSLVKKPKCASCMHDV